MPKKALFEGILHALAERFALRHGNFDERAEVRIR
jgi:hypothetical protein